MDKKIVGVLKIIVLVSLFAAPYARIVVYNLPVYLYDIFLAYLFLSNWKKLIEKIFPIFLHLIVVLLLFRDYNYIYIYMRLFLGLSLFVYEDRITIKKSLNVALIITLFTLGIELIFTKTIWVLMYKYSFGINVLNKERFFHGADYDFRFIGFFLNSNIAAGAMILQMIASYLLHGRSYRIILYGLIILATASKLGIIVLALFSFKVYSKIKVISVLSLGLLVLASGVVPFRDILSKEVYIEAISSRSDNFILYCQSLLQWENIPFGRGYNYVASRFWKNDGSLISSGPLLFLSYFGLYSYVIIMVFWREILKVPFWILFMVIVLWISDNYIMVVPFFSNYVFLLCGILSTTHIQKLKSEV